MSSAIPDQYLASFTIEQTVLFPISTLSAMFFVYGIYVLLFATYVYMARGRNDPGERLNHNLYVTLTVALFVLTTIFVVNITVYYPHGAVVRFDAVKKGDYDLLAKYLNWDDLERRAGYSIVNFVAVFLNITAEWMLVHRCYVVWGSNRVVAVPLIVMSVVINALGLVYSIITSAGICALARGSDSWDNLLTIASTTSLAYITSSTAANLIITLLTAGRIWWIHRQVRSSGAFSSDGLVESVSRFILESGLIYPTVSTLSLILSNTVFETNASFDLYPLAVLSAGLAPTLIMVRARLGKNVESLRVVLSDIRFTSQPGQRELTSESRSQVPVHSIGDFGVVKVGEQNGHGNSKEASTIV